MNLPRHLTSSTQLTPDVIDAVCKEADKMEKLRGKQGRGDLLQEKVVALLFYEPSSRTMLSFQTAVQRLGGGMILAQGKESSSLKKGESIEDTIQMVMGYADCIVMRHAEEGSADRAASVCDVPFINAGDGGNEHPTQAILDAYTIKKELGKLENLHIAVACDPKHSRTIRSLVRVMSQYSGNRFTLISPENLRLGDDLRQTLEEREVPFEETNDLSHGTDADVLYMNRLQEERFEDHDEFERLRKQLTLTPEMLEGKSVIILDPLPRLDEIDRGVDSLPNAAYFRQAKNGVPVRMALLKMMLG